MRNDREDRRSSEDVPRVAVVIVSYETRELTMRAIQSVMASSGVSAEIWVVDNASSDGSAEAIRLRFPSVRLIAMEENVGFGRANNSALDEIDAPYVLILNSDAALPERTTLARLVESLESRPDSGILGPLLQTSQGRTSYSAHPFPSMRQELIRAIGLYPLTSRRALDRWIAKEYRDHTISGPADWLPGACLLVRGEVLTSVGGFDPALFLYGEDLDWCWRARKAGWEVTLDAGVSVVHEGAQSSGALSDWKIRLGLAGEAYAIRKHRGRAYFAAFAAVRGAAFILRWLLQGTAGRRSRAAEAWAALRYWTFVLRHGGAREPGSERFLRAIGRT
jgi:GT2 family glycosyltransferase